MPPALACTSDSLVKDFEMAWIDCNFALAFCILDDPAFSAARRYLATFVG